MISPTALRADVEQLTAPGHRLAGSPEHATIRRWLTARLESLGLEGAGPGGAFELPYVAQRTGVTLTNVVARLPGRRPELPPVLLAAHTDTCGPYPGADDNAAAIAELLAIAPLLRAQSLERSVLFAFFDAEEPEYFLSPDMGSNHWYRAQRDGPVHAAIVLDLCGHACALPGLEDLLVCAGLESHPGIEALLPVDRDAPGLSLLSVPTEAVGDMSDYACFRAHGDPFVFLTCGRWPHYHQPTDTPDKLCYDKMAAIAGLLLTLTTELCAKPLGPKPAGHDAAETLVASARRVFTPLLGPAGEVQSLGDARALLAQIQGRFGL